MTNVLIFIERLFMQTAVSSAKMAVIVLILLCLTVPVTSRYRAGWRYYSWLAVMLVFMVPFSMLGFTYRAEIPAVQNAAVTAGEWVSDHAPTYEITEQKLLPVESDEYQADSAPETVTYTYRKSINVKRILSLIWLGAAIIFFAVHIRRYIVFRRALKRHIEAVTDENILAALEAEKRDMGIKAKIPICKSPVITSPMLTGFFKPLLLLPEQELGEQELHLVLRHELTHYKRRDIWYQFILLVFLSLHWFNPVAYIMAKAIEIDGETSCDERVLEDCPYETRVFYGEMLIDFLRRNNQKRSYLTTTFFGGKKGMKKRLNLIASEKLRKRGTAAMSALIAFAVTASVSAAAAQPWDEEMLKFFNDPSDRLMEMIDANVARPQVRAENNGTVVEVRQTIIDDHQFAVLLDITAPEGTDLTGDTYAAYLMVECNPIGSDGKYCGGGGRRKISVEGNKMTYVYTGILIDAESAQPESAASYEMHLSFNNIYRSIPGANAEDDELLAECSFDFTWEAQHTDLSVNYAPYKTVTFADGSKGTVTQIQLSPLSAFVYLTNYGELTMERYDVLTATLHMRDGSDIKLGLTDDESGGIGECRPDYRSVELDGDPQARIFTPMLLMGNMLDKIIDISECESVTIGDATIRFDELAPVNAADINYDPIMSDWARDAVKKAISKDIVNLYTGYGNLTRNITREEFCWFAYRALIESGCMEERDYYEIYENPYSEPVGNEAIALYYAGIMQGKGDKIFAPHDYITREEAAVIVKRMSDYAKKQLGGGSAPEYADENEISDWAKDAVSALGMVGIMNGDGTNFNPKGAYTIEQAAVTMIKWLDL